MSEFVVHATPGSPYARAAMAALEEKGADWRLVALQPGTSRQPEHLSRHPFGRMPVLDHGAFSVYETQAVLRYLDRVLPQPALTPADPRAAARMDQVMNIVDWYLFQGCGNIITFQRVIRPLLFGQPTDEDAVLEAMPRAHVVFTELARLLGEADWFGGDNISLADLMVAPHFDFFAQTPEWHELTAKHSKLVNWLARAENRPSFRATTWAKVKDMAAGLATAKSQI
ncbi:glutathione S-transferase family protein [Bradyrhizobium commune]|uniref:glutathione transferase n=1 Tax=Bradyrhizobium commune TaxID=83627 RepID=A0A7S9D4G9_9BRAD|nr:glutathione S-transferase family protein [Bradyrhizobium commune]QPF91028.1 glutathione S-transferase family protein [Bradyrhizobium commune]